MKGYKAKSHYLCIKKWVIDAVNKKQPKKEESKQSYERGYTDLNKLYANIE
jgi:hypothetical protein